MTREEIIKPLIKGRSVLDIGSLGQSEEYLFWSFLQKNCAKLTGIDLPSAEDTARGVFGLDAKNLQHSADSRIVFGNMETYVFDEKFDVIIAGDVIEHVSNQGLFINNIKKHLKDDGKLIITTPNAKWPTVFLTPNPTHTMWHDIYTIENLLERFEYRITYIKYYCGNKPYYNLLKKLLAWRQSFLVIAEVK